MSAQDKKRDPLPASSAPLTELAEFWDQHDTMDYQDTFITVQADFDIQRHRYEVEISEDVYKAAKQRSKSMEVPIADILDGILRKHLISVA